MEYYSQFGQDKYCNENLFKNKKDGIFLDIGASDGITISNTLFFERFLNWTGLCIEPRELAYKKLIEIRKCNTENVAISDKSSNSETFLEIDGYGSGLSGIISKYDPRHIIRIKEEIKNPNYKGQKIINVKTVLLQELLDKYDMKEIDLLSIDTEGGELDIIKTINWDKCKIKVIDIENNYNDDSIKEYLEGLGYKFNKRIVCDEIYTKF